VGLSEASNLRFMSSDGRPERRGLGCEKLGVTSIDRRGAKAGDRGL
jgi:hypothetical protein